jgi:hypothetical protein
MAGVLLRVPRDVQDISVSADRFSARCSREEAQLHAVHFMLGCNFVCLE